MRLCRFAALVAALCLMGTMASCGKKNEESLPVEIPAPAAVQTLMSEEPVNAETLVPTEVPVPTWEEPASTEPVSSEPVSSEPAPVVFTPAPTPEPTPVPTPAPTVVPPPAFETGASAPDILHPGTYVGSDGSILIVNEDATATYETEVSGKINGKAMTASLVFHGVYENGGFTFDKVTYGALDLTALAAAAGYTDASPWETAAAIIYGAG